MLQPRRLSGPAPQPGDYPINLIHEFLRSLDPATLRGAVVALPILNLTAFRVHRRSSPFEGFNNTDLNRCFPGNPNGGFTDRMAYAIYGARCLLIP